MNDSYKISLNPSISIFLSWNKPVESNDLHADARWIDDRIYLNSVTALDYLVITDPTTNQIKQRLIIVGHANGLIDFHVTEIQSDGTWKTTSTTLEYDSFISSVKFFYHNHKPKPGNSFLTHWKLCDSIHSLILDEQPLLLITGALEPAVIYR